MATTTDNVIWFTGRKILGVRLLGYGDTAETDVVKVDKSALTGLNGKEPSYIKILEAVGHVNNLDYVLLEWDGTSDNEALLFPPGTSYHDFTSGGGIYVATSGTTGDLVLTSSGVSGTLSYQIDLVLQLMD